MTNTESEQSTELKSFIKDAIVSIIEGVKEAQETLSELTLFDEQDLRDFASCAHRCLLKAVEELMMVMELDPSKIERKSRGLLGIS